MLGMSARPHRCGSCGATCVAAASGRSPNWRRYPQGTSSRVAGWAISAQRPPTAKGMGFLVLEDETRTPARRPAAARVAEQMHRVLRDARVVDVAGGVERVRWYRSLLGYDLRAIA